MFAINERGRCRAALMTPAGRSSMSLPASDLSKQPDNRTTMELGAVLPETAEVRDGHLFIGGVDMVELAKREGTALYVYDEADIRHRMERYRDAFSICSSAASIWSSWRNARVRRCTSTTRRTFAIAWSVIATRSNRVTGTPMSSTRRRRSSTRRPCAWSPRRGFAWMCRAAASSLARFRSVFPPSACSCTGTTKRRVSWKRPSPQASGASSSTAASSFASSLARFRSVFPPSACSCTGTTKRRVSWKRPSPQASGASSSTAASSFVASPR